MDPETALELVKHGTTLLLLDVPQYTLVGIDTQMFSTGPHFKGIKMIPPGVHFIYYSSSNRDGSEFSPIIGFFVDTSPSQLDALASVLKDAESLNVNKFGIEETNSAVKSHPCHVESGEDNDGRTKDYFQQEDSLTQQLRSKNTPDGGRALPTKKQPEMGDLDFPSNKVRVDGDTGMDIYGPGLKNEVIVRKWDQEEEHFVKLCEEEEERFSNAVKRLEFDKNLGPYTLTHYGEWKCLSNYITKNTIDRIEPVGGEITIACESEIVGSIPKTEMEKAWIEQLKNSKFSKPIEKSHKRGCYYTPIPRVVKHKGMNTKDLTIMNLDKTQLLESILTKAYEGDEDLLLGELQFAFIAFLMGQSLEAFLQWKLLIGLFLGCTEAPLHTRSRLFTKFIQVIYYQLKYGLKNHRKDTGTAAKGVTALLDESWLSSDSFLHRLCKDFFSLVLEAPVVDGDLLIWTRKLKELLEDSLGWQFNENSAVDGMYIEDDDEYAPVVEMLDDSGTA